ncbi:MAG: histidinol-phosphate transaminase [Rhodococcus sp.]|uniref:histidinol-phosphate transaminase n=1 Tax=Nocardiaceae TaxID=85025 RepID=UPI00050CBFC7|nr:MULTISPECIES: histidinol-phosphate transaminase [Rhodococcus]MSX05191.1 histidinol-phosphate transaminase [Actinomycetota bacterium]MBJ7324210.1 histidinol-phosphate transaminase [Rhodococcus sp. (in: high G+C Gram-positive bacteria)]MCX6490559.1 histidinol-phosphate transaminase [Rhodococcus sp. (in: high G+C Gram-positive bacteria)]MDJ0425483.1 histidinol-phosphate transaminase [Rhodococcus fascians]WQH28647.1 histidinol-phosphate transaminase [Rhodococcus fascians]
MTVHIRPDLDAIPAYVPGRSFPGAIKLASNETTQGPLPSVREAIVEAAGGVNRYPDIRATALVESLAEKLGVAPENVAAGNGSVALCQEVVQITCGPGDEVIFAWRSFEAYPIIVRVTGATPVQVPLTSDHVHDLDAMLDAITERTRLIFVCNPNNPSGTVVQRDKLVAFLDAVPPNVLVVLDEAYFEYTRPDAAGNHTDGVEIARGRRNVIVLRTFSKAYGLAGLRVGYAVADPEVITALSKVRIAFAVSTIAQQAALASLEASAELLARTDALIAERDRVRDALVSGGYDVGVSQSNFIWLPLGERSGEFASGAAEQGVLLRSYGNDGVRVTIGDPHENDAFLKFALQS